MLSSLFVLSFFENLSDHNTTTRIYANLIKKVFLFFFFFFPLKCSSSLVSVREREWEF